MSHLLRADLAYLTTHWAVIGPFIGILVGSWIASRWQRWHWIRDNKKVEYRQIFDALHKFRWLVTDHMAFYNESPFVDKKAEGRKFEQQVAIMQALSETMGTLMDRLFTRDVILGGGVHRDFQGFYHSLESEKPPDYQSAARAVAKIHKRVLELAWKDLRVPGRFRGERLELFERYANANSQTHTQSK